MARKPWRIGIGSAMIGIAALAFCLATVRASPWIGVGLAMVLLPGVIRATMWIEGHAIDDRAMDWSERFAAYLDSIVVAAAIFGGTWLAFIGTATLTLMLMVALGKNSGPDAEFALAGSLLGAGAAGLTFAYWLTRRLWPRKD